MHCEDSNTRFCVLSALWLAVLSHVTHLYLHTLWLDDVDFVLVAAPHLVMHHGHASDWVVWPAQVHQVVVGQIPLSIWIGKITTIKTGICTGIFTQKQPYTHLNAQEKRTRLCTANIQTETAKQKVLRIQKWKVWRGFFRIRHGLILTMRYTWHK